MKRIISIINGIMFLLIVCLLMWNHTIEKQFSESVRAINKAETKEKIAIKEEIIQCHDELQETVAEVLPGIICWRDSLTAGAGGDGITWPSILKENISQKLLAEFDSEILAKKIGGDISEGIAGLSYYNLHEIDVINMGVGGEDTNTILGRNGAIPFVVAEDLTIPETAEAIEIKIKSSNGKNVAPLRQGNRGINTVTISGIEGVISIEQESYLSPTYKYFFKRSRIGESLYVSAGTKIYTDGSTKYLDYIPIIFIGQNGGYSDLDELVTQQKAIINHQNMNEKNSEKFLIIGLHTGTAESRAELERRMKQEYGKQYLNIREYMSKDALSDAGISATAKDSEMMQKGMTPESLLSDDIHFNAKGYELLGNLIYERMDELGYFDEVKETISAMMYET